MPRKVSLLGPAIHAVPGGVLLVSSRMNPELPVIRITTEADRHEIEALISRSMQD